MLAALREREVSGEGQMIDVSMLDCQIAIQENAFMRYFVTGEVPHPLGTRHPAATPFQAFQTKDGYVVLAVSWGVENQWELFCALIERPALINDERFDTPHARTANHAELEPLLNDALMQRTTAEWIAEFDAIGLPCGQLNNIAQAAALPQVKAREMLVERRSPAHRHRAAREHARQAFAHARRNQGALTRARRAHRCRLARHAEPI